jgi:hypothetical protein
MESRLPYLPEYSDILATIGVSSGISRESDERLPKVRTDINVPAWNFPLYDQPFCPAIVPYRTILLTQALHFL